MGHESVVAISIGDVTGIGPEVTLRALAAELPKDETRYILVGDEEWLQRTKAGLKLTIGWSPFAPKSAARIQFLGDNSLPLALAAGASEAARAAVKYLRMAAELCLRGDARALVTAPVSKEAIMRAGMPFVGQTEFLSELAGAKRTAMMLLGTDEQGRWLRVALATTHLPLRRVADELTQAKIEQAIELASEACSLLRLQRARIGVCGLNPHAGEGGKLGTEEQTIIAPALEATRPRNIDVAGPFPADTLFHRVLHGEFDAVVAMYHDQGLAPLKMVAFETGVNWTLGLPFVRTSPAHGTAYDIAGKGVANPSSMVAALRLARQLIRA